MENTNGNVELDNIKKGIEFIENKKDSIVDSKVIKKYRYKALINETEFVETGYYLNKDEARESLEDMTNTYLGELLNEFNNSEESEEEGELEQNEYSSLEEIINKNEKNNYLPENLEYNTSIPGSRVYLVFMNQFCQKFKINQNYICKLENGNYKCKLIIGEKVFYSKRAYKRKIDAKEDVAKQACNQLDL